MSRFIIVDITEPDGVPQELAAVVPNLHNTPVQPIQAAEAHGASLVADLPTLGWVLNPLAYEYGEQLPETIENIFQAVEAKSRELTG
jgi:hypothetical protein